MAFGKVFHGLKSLFQRSGDSRADESSEKRDDRSLELYTAIQNGDDDAIDALIQDPNYQEWINNNIDTGVKEPIMDMSGRYEPIFDTCLNLACRKSTAELVRRMVGAGADVDVITAQASIIHDAYASDVDRREKLEVLLAKDPGLIASIKLHYNDRCGLFQTLLCTAIRKGNVADLEFLVKHGSDVNAPTRDFSQEWTALHYAAYCGRVDVFRELIRLDVCATNATESESPLVCAAMGGNAEVIQEITRLGPNVNALSYRGFSALHCAAQLGHVNCIHELIKHGAFVEIRSRKRGCTPLMMAILENQQECVRILIDVYGCNPNATDKKGRTAIELKEKWKDWPWRF